jgi:hypothetical protein
MEISGRAVRRSRGASRVEYLNSLEENTDDQMW